MQINNNLQHQKFNGKLYISPNISDDIVASIKNSQAIKKILASPNDLHVETKIRAATDTEIFKEGKDDILYKMYFFVTKPVKSFRDKISNFFVTKKSLTSRYHSSQTNKHLINKEEHMSKILEKWIKNN